MAEGVARFDEPHNPCRRAQVANLGLHRAQRDGVVPPARGEDPPVGGRLTHVGAARPAAVRLHQVDPRGIDMGSLQRPLHRPRLSLGAGGEEGGAAAVAGAADATDDREDVVPRRLRGLEPLHHHRTLRRHKALRAVVEGEGPAGADDIERAEGYEILGEKIEGHATGDDHICLAKRERERSGMDRDEGACAGGVHRERASGEAVRRGEPGGAGHPRVVLHRVLAHGDETLGVARSNALEQRLQRCPREPALREHVAGEPEVTLTGEAPLNLQLPLPLPEGQLPEDDLHPTGVPGTLLESRRPDGLRAREQREMNGAVHPREGQRRKLEAPGIQLWKVHYPRQPRDDGALLEEWTENFFTSKRARGRS